MRAAGACILAASICVRRTRPNASVAMMTATTNPGHRQEKQCSSRQASQTWASTAATRISKKVSTPGPPSSAI